MRKAAWLVGGICAVGALIAQFPASWAARVTAAELLTDEVQISGTIWQGRITGLEGVGPIDFQTYPRHLFSDKPLVTFYSQLSGMQAKGGARLGHISDLIFKGRVSTFSLLDSRLAGLGGIFDVAIDDIIYEGETCSQAAGRASTDFLASNAAQWAWQGPALSGPVSCENGEIVLRMTGARDGQNIEMTLRSNLSGLYTNIAQVQTRDPNAQFALSLFGFVQNGQTYQLEQTGSWK